MLIFLFALFAHVAHSEQTQTPEPSLRESIPFQKPLDFVNGEMQVPIDWQRSLSDDNQLTIHYRILGASHTDRPFLFLVGGGPGKPSIENYFKAPAQQDGAMGYSKHYRVVLFDQRGTGLSSPIDGSSNRLTAPMAMKYFSGKAHALDLGALVKNLNAPARQFFLMGHSYGGLVVQQYLANRKSGPLPKGILLASAMPTSLAPREFLRERILNQIRLNEELITPDLREMILATRAKMDALQHKGLSGKDLDLLFTEVTNEDSVAQLKTILQTFLLPSSDGNTIDHMLHWRRGQFIGDRLMCFISGCDITAPYSDLAITRILQGDLKDQIKDWMLTEIGAFMASSNSEHAIAMNNEVDALAGEFGVKPLIKETRKALRSVMMLDLASDRDPMVPMSAVQKDFAQLSGTRFHHFEPVEGGNHFSVLSPQIADWVAEQFANWESAWVCGVDLTN
jgi:pimeloyl-ACP methyl ester carboxylesterase